MEPTSCSGDVHKKAKQRLKRRSDEESSKSCSSGGTKKKGRRTKCKTGKEKEPEVKSVIAERARVRR